MSAIPCSSVSLKTMADGTLRISFDIEPKDAQDAFRLFAAPGTPAAIAALQVGYAAASEAVNPVSEKPKGGPLAKLAGMWCNDPEFWSWIDVESGGFGCDSATCATGFIYLHCHIDSRTELDHDPVAAEKFHRLIRGPYQKYLAARGIAQ